MASLAAKQLAAGALRVVFDGCDLITSSGAAILQGLPVQASAVPSTDGMSAVIGVRTAAGPASLFDCALGKLACTRFLALGRTSIWWMTPAWGSLPSEVPVETQFLLLELAGGAYALLLPLIHDNKFRGTLRPPSRGGGDSIVLRMESGDAAVLTEECSSALLVAASTDPFELIQRGVTLAAALSGTAKHRSTKEVPPAVEGFGWCTWDAFYSRVSAAGIQEGVKALAEGGAAPRFVIIDDGWQATDVDPQYRKAAAEGCTAGGFGMGAHLDAAKQVEEAMAGLLSGPDNHMDQTLQAAHEIHAMAGLPSPSDNQVKPSNGALQGPGAGFFSVVRAWLAAAYEALRDYTGQLEAAFLLRCKKILDSLPANSWRMRLFSALATGPFKGTLLRFYAQASDHTRRLCSVRANSKFAHPGAGPDFPLNSTGGDLKVVVAALKRQHSGLTHIFCWHAMGGFWGGLSAGEREMQKYGARLLTPVPSPSLLELDPAVAWVQPVLSGVTLPLDPTQLHRDMHSYLAACGVDGVKVDVQSTIGVVGSAAGGGPALSAQYHASLEASARQFFPGNSLINCMCHSTEDLYRMEDTNLARVSDDFYPLLQPSHSAHIANCAFNTLLMGELVIPDWDMFHSVHDKALLHATARAVSGGPVYVSDRPGQHDFAMLRRLVLLDGSVLRCQLPGRPTADCLFADISRDGRTVLKVWNANACTGVVAVFNIQGSSYSRALRRFHTHDPTPPALAVVVSPADVPALRGAAADLFAVYRDSTKEFELLHPEGRMELTVAGGGGSDVLTISPVLEAGGVRAAPIGLVGMLNAGGAVLSCSLSGGEAEGVADAEAQQEEKASGFELVPPVLSLVVKGCGGFLLYASHRPTAVLAVGQQLAFSYDRAKAAMMFEVPAGGALEKQCEVRF